MAWKSETPVATVRNKYVAQWPAAMRNQDATALARVLRPFEVPCVRGSFASNAMRRFASNTITGATSARNHAQDNSLLRFLLSRAKVVPQKGVFKRVWTCRAFFDISVF